MRRPLGGGSPNRLPPGAVLPVPPGRAGPRAFGALVVVVKGRGGRGKGPDAAAPLGAEGT